MIELIQDKNNYTIAILKGDSHQSKWVKEQLTLETDQTVPVRLLPLIKEGDVVCDVGANIGSHTVSYAKKVGDKGRVYAFEPLMLAYAALSVNCRDFMNVGIFNVALGNQHEPKHVFLPDGSKANGEVNYGMAMIGDIGLMGLVQMIHWMILTCHAAISSRLIAKATNQTSFAAQWKH